MARNKICQCQSLTKIEVLQLHMYEFAYEITILKLPRRFLRILFVHVPSVRNLRRLLIEESEKKERVKERKRRCSRERDAEVRVPGTPAH